jgi:hypothetical protein
MKFLGMTLCEPWYTLSKPNERLLWTKYLSIRSYILSSFSSSSKVYKVRIEISFKSNTCIRTPLLHIRSLINKHEVNQHLHHLFRCPYYRTATHRASKRNSNSNEGKWRNKRRHQGRGWPLLPIATCTCRRGKGYRPSLAPTRGALRTRSDFSARDSARMRRCARIANRMKTGKGGE